MSLKHIPKETWTIAKKDLVDFSRSRLRLVMLVLMPMFMMLMMGFIFPSQSSYHDLPVAIVDQDGGNMSHQFVSDFKAMVGSSNTMKTKTYSSYDTARTDLLNSRLDAIIVIPKGFSDNITHGRQGNITVVTDESNPQISSVLSSMVTTVINTMSKQHAIKDVTNMLAADGGNNNATGNATGGSATSGASADANATALAIAIVTPYKVKATGAGSSSSSGNYFEFIAPGMMMMVVMMSVMTGLPRAISHEREIGTMDGLMMAPISRFSIILGKTLSQTIRGMAQGIIVLLLAVTVLGVTIHGSLVLVFGLMILGVFSFIGLGVAITSIAREEESAMMLMMAFQFPMLFLSGVFFPIQQMPTFMQYISKAIPLTYAADAMRKVIVLGAGIQDIYLDLLVLVGFGVVMMIVAVPLFSRMMTRD